MRLTFPAESLPLRVDESGVVRVGPTRIPIDTVVCEYNAGSTAEEIVLHFDTLRLEDVYFTIAYYLRHKAEVDAYVAEREREADALQKEAEARFSWPELRQRLIARQQRMADTSASR